MAIRAVEQVFNGVTVPLAISNGTVAVSGTTVTGKGTVFNAGMVGLQIGFGSTTVSSITTWYNITALTSYVSISINTTPGTLAAGTEYVITGYDSTKTSMGSLMVQKSGPNPEDNYVGPLPVAVARPWEESTGAATWVFPHAITISNTIDWVFLVESTANAAKRIIFYEYNKALATYNWKGFITMTTPQATNAVRGFRALRYLHTTGTVTVGAPTLVQNASTVTVTVAGVVTCAAANFLASHIGMMIGFGSNSVAAINTWCPIVSFTSTTVIGISGSSSAFPAGTAYVIASCTVTGTGTLFSTEDISAGTASSGVAGGAGPRIGFGSTDPAQIANWYQIGFITSDTALNLTTTPGIIAAGVPYVIEEMRFALTQTNTTPVTAGGLFVLKGAGYNDFTTAGTTFPSIASNVNNQRGVYWLADMSTVTNISATGCAIQPEINKGLHYAYVMDGISPASSPYAMKVYRYNLRATDPVAAGKMTLSVAYTTAGTVTVSDSPATGSVVGSGTSFTVGMVGMKIGFGATSPALITTWYTVASFTDGTHITLTTSAGTIGSASAYIIDSANVISTANEMITGSGVANVAALNNGRIGTLNHGPGANVESLYFVTGNRIYRAPVSKIYAGSLEWVSENRPEVPPGSINTYPATNALSCVEIADAMDRLIIVTSSATAFKHYITRYPQTAGDQFDSIFGVDDKQQDQASADPDTAIHFNTSSQVVSIWSENGIAHIVRHGASAALHQMYALPLSAHWMYAGSSNQQIITPSLSTPNCASFKRVLVSAIDHVGNKEFILPTGSIFTYYRTNGITDNSGDWTLVPRDNDLSGLAPAGNIQFMFQFETVGLLCIPGRIMSMAVVYDDFSTDPHYQPSAGKTVLASKQFAWRFATAFGTTVPTLRIRLYDAVTGGLLLDDNSATPVGTWEKITGSTGWGPYDSIDKIDELTYIRYTPATLADNIKTRALLTLY